MQTKALCASFVSSRFILFWPCAEPSMIGSFVARSKCVAAVAIRFWLFRRAELWHRERSTASQVSHKGRIDVSSWAPAHGADICRKVKQSVRMNGVRRPGVLFCMGIAIVAAATLAASSATAADRIRIAAQRTGTLAWELDILKAHGLDRQAGIDIETTELASTEAGKVALEGGSVDLMLSDWLWVTRERALGDDVVFYPYSSALGAVMVPANSPIGGIADLKGKRLAVAGGPLDKSWLLLRALARRSNIDLKTQADIVYGAPPLLQQKALQGETDATLTFWNFCAALETNGMRRAVAMEDVVKSLGAAGPVAMVGYVFNANWAQRNRSLLDRFFAATRQAKDILAQSPDEWQRLAPRISASGTSALDVYRQRYLEGIPRRSLGAEVADARTLYNVLAEIGGTDLVGPARELDPGTFYTAGPSE
jgi:NitT/TauT family transport system substrate-binding protein